MSCVLSVKTMRKGAKEQKMKPELCKSHATFSASTKSTKALAQQASERRKKWTLDVQRKQHFVRITIFRVRAHNGNVMNFLISISTNLFKHIFHVNAIGWRWLLQYSVDNKCAWICWKTYLWIVIWLLSSSFVTVANIRNFSLSLSCSFSGFQTKCFSNVQFTHHSLCCFFTALLNSKQTERSVYKKVQIVSRISKIKTKKMYRAEIFVHATFPSEWSGNNFQWKQQFIIE